MKRIVLPLLFLPALCGCLGDVKGPAPSGYSTLNYVYQLGARNPCWSPDGGEIAFDCEGDLWVVPDGGWTELEGTPASRRITGFEGSEREPALHPDPTDGRIVFVHDEVDSSRIKLLDTDDGTTLTLFSSSAMIRRPSWTSDGKQISFTLISDYEQGIYLVDPVADSQPQLIPKSNSWGEIVYAKASPSKPLIWFVEKSNRVENLYSIPLDGGLSQIYSANGVGTVKFDAVGEARDGNRLAVALLAFDKDFEAWYSNLYLIRTTPPSPDWSRGGLVALTYLDPTGDYLIRCASIDWSPQGDRLALGVRYGTGDNALWDVAVLDLR
ncbi:TolB family protein [candidate division KSB1 bacterium]